MSWRWQRIHVNCLPTDLHVPSSGHRGRMAPKGVSSRWEMQAVVKVRVGGGWKGAPEGAPVGLNTLSSGGWRQGVSSPVWGFSSQVNRQAGPKMGSLPGEKQASERGLSSGGTLSVRDP